MVRTTAIWVFGLLASAIGGGLIAQWLEPYDRGTPMLGALAGMFG
jgi:hypothetical protein